MSKVSVTAGSANINIGPETRFALDDIHLVTKHVISKSGADSIHDIELEGGATIHLTLSPEGFVKSVQSNGALGISVGGGRVTIKKYQPPPTK